MVEARQFVSVTVNNVNLMGEYNLSQITQVGDKHTWRASTGKEIDFYILIFCMCYWST